MTDVERQAIEQEIDQLRAYANAGTRAHMVYRRGAGWTVTRASGGLVEGLTKRVAFALVEREADVCQGRVCQLRARLTADALSQDIADTPVEERQASARAQVAAIDGPRWKRSA